MPETVNSKPNRWSPDDAELIRALIEDVDSGGNLFWRGDIVRLMNMLATATHEALFSFWSTSALMVFCGDSHVPVPQSVVDLQRIATALNYELPSVKETTKTN